MAALITDGHLLVSVWTLSDRRDWSACTEKVLQCIILDVQMFRILWQYAYYRCGITYSNSNRIDEQFKIRTNFG